MACSIVTRTAQRDDPFHLKTQKGTDPLVVRTLINNLIQAHVRTTCISWQDSTCLNNFKLRCSVWSEVKAARQHSYDIYEKTSWKLIQSPCRGVQHNYSWRGSTWMEVTAPCFFQLNYSVHYFFRTSCIVSAQCGPLSKGTMSKRSNQESCRMNISNSDADPFSGGCSQKMILLF